MAFHVAEGLLDGELDGEDDGLLDGLLDGELDGLLDGEADGLADGELDGQQVEPTLQSSDTHSKRIPYVSLRRGVNSPVAPAPGYGTPKRWSIA